MNVDKTILFFDINLDVNNELHELGITKEIYSIDLTNDLDLNLRKKINKKNERKNYDLIYIKIDNFFIKNLELLKFCEYTLNITNLSMETDGPTIGVLNNYKSFVFNNYPIKIYELLLDWFGIKIIDAINSGLKAKCFGVKDI